MKSDSIQEFVLDQLCDLDELGCRPMFGGYGLYMGGLFFGIIFQGGLYFKTGPATVHEFLGRGMQPLRPNKKITLKSYYEVPADVIEDAELLTEWAERAITNATV